jgi:hypothetical protein
MPWTNVRLGAGQNDGLQKCWLNGELAFEANDLLYRNDAGADKLIGAMHWHNYHGGSDDQWAPKHDQHIWCVPGIIPHRNCIESFSPDPEFRGAMMYSNDVQCIRVYLDAYDPACSGRIKARTGLSSTAQMLVYWFDPISFGPI